MGCDAACSSSISRKTQTYVCTYERRPDKLRRASERANERGSGGEAEAAAATAALRCRELPGGTYVAAGEVVGRSGRARARQRKTRLWVFTRVARAERLPRGRTHAHKRERERPCRPCSSVRRNLALYTSSVVVQSPVRPPCDCLSTVARGSAPRHSPSAKNARLRVRPFAPPLRSTKTAFPSCVRRSGRFQTR